MFFGFVTETTEITNFFRNCPMEFITLSLLSVNIFFVKALRQGRQIWEVMKRWNVNYGKKLKQWSDEAFNAGKETEAMKRLTLHRIASALHRFIASGAQLCWIHRVQQHCPQPNLDSAPPVLSLPGSGEAGLAQRLRTTRLSSGRVGLCWAVWAGLDVGLGQMSD